MPEARGSASRRVGDRFGMRARRPATRALVLCWLGFAGAGCSREAPERPVPAVSPTLKAEVVRAYPHDPGAFTQGLLFFDGRLYESTGLENESTLRAVELETGRVLLARSLPAPLFGEGLARVGDRLVQLTWRNKLGLVYSLPDLREIARFRYPVEGWGLAYDGRRLIMSDGTSRLYRLDPETFELVDTVVVRDASGPVSHLNELEMVRGELWANIWPNQHIARIDPASGRVIGRIDAAGLLSPEDRAAGMDVLNGIAYDEAGDRIFLTGKRWPKVYEIRLVEPGGRDGRTTSTNR